MVNKIPESEVITDYIIYNLKLICTKIKQYLAIKICNYTI